MIRRAMSILLCCTGLSLTGCVIVIPTIPVNAPGYGHSYEVLDQHDRPIRDGFLILHSFYRVNDYMFRIYPIKNGRVDVPEKIGTRCSAGGYWLYVPVWSVTFENPYATYVYPVAPGHVYAGGWTDAPWGSPDFLDGLSPPPKTFRMREAAPDLEREDVEALWYPAQIRLQPTEDQAARDALLEYVKKRLGQLPPSKIELLEKAIAQKDVQEIRRQLDSGADVNFEHLYSLWRPIYRGVMTGNAEIVRLLIEKGARVNVLDATNRSPWYFAEDEAVKKLLLEHGADPKLGEPLEQVTTQPAGGVPLGP